MLKRKSRQIIDEEYEDEQGISQYDEQYLDEPEYGDSLDDYQTEVSNDAEKSRLLIETDSYINRIQLTLENKYIEKRRILKNGVEEYKQELRQIPNTRPLANNFGISQIMGHLKGKISHVTGLGNISEDRYRIFMGRFIKDFARQLIGHAEEWGVRPQDIRDIRRIIVDGVELFLTRPLGDKERAYNWNPQSIENKKQEDKGFLGNIIQRKNERRGY